MKKTLEELLDSFSGVAKAECDPGMIKKIVRLFRSICRKERKLQVNVICVDNLILDLHSELNRKIDELILEHKGKIIKRNYE